MEYTVKDIQRLRETTGAGPLDCKKALEEATSFENAVAWLEEKGKKRAEKIAGQDRETRQGYIAAYTHFAGNLGALVELNCSTDFVSRNDEFRALGAELALQVAAMDPKYITLEEIPAEVAEDKTPKELESMALMTQPWFKDEKVKIADLINDLIRKTGENIIVRRFVRFKLGE
ncbi:MAG TPA: elongation factor Ts [Ktedonobacterales bacterium]|jgi:elongation factor Ts